MPTPPRHFSTARLSARPPRAEDAPAAFAAYGSDPDVTRYLSWAPYTAVEPMAQFFHEQADVWRTGRGQYAWLLFRRDTAAPLGSIGVGFEDGKALFGYVLAKAHWGQGLMTEALTARSAGAWPSRRSSGPGPTATPKTPPRSA